MVHIYCFKVLEYFHIYKVKKPHQVKDISFMSPPSMFKMLNLTDFKPRRVEEHVFVAVDANPIFKRMEETPSIPLMEKPQYHVAKKSGHKRNVTQEKCGHNCNDLAQCFMLYEEKQKVFLNARYIDISYLCFFIHSHN